MIKPPNPNQVIRFDWAMKTILRDKANFDVLEGFLSALLNEPITVLQLLESESNQSTEKMKYNRVDILVADSQNRHVIIEIQNNHETDYLYRLLFGSSKIIIDTLEIGQPYREIAKVISISILYFNLGSGNDYIYYGSTEFVGLHTQEPLTLRQLEITPTSKYYRDVDLTKEIFPEYYLIQVGRFEDIVEQPLDEWIYMLKHAEIPAHFTARNIAQARAKLSLLQMSSDERRRYEKYMQALVSERDIVETAENKGFARGHQQGQDEGRQAEKIAIAQNMLANGLPTTLIAQMTELSLAEIEALTA